jgi:hypothetical protein
MTVRTTYQRAASGYDVEHERSGTDVGGRA